MAHKKSHNTRPNVEIYVVERGCRIPRSRYYKCRDQVDIRYHEQVLPAYFFRDPTDRFLDLLRLIASVAHADRRVCRRPSVCWGRDIKLFVPVSDPDFWNGEVSSRLVHALSLLTGDCWAFDFRRAQSKLELSVQTRLELPPQQELTMAYSKGLDSFAVAQLVPQEAIKIESGDANRRNIILVTTGSEVRAELQRSQQKNGHSTRQISIPFRVVRTGPRYQLREISYRSRAFVFHTLAAFAAYQSGGNTVVIAESGQGSIGPWLTVTGQESPDVRAHPLFTSALADVLEPIFGTRPIFEHPQLWHTKGETLKILRDNNLHSGVEKTFSCAIQVRHQEHEGKRRHCGVCPNCLLRRQSLLAAGITNLAEQYDYDSSAKTSEDLGLAKRLSQGILPLVELARLLDTPLLNKVANSQIASFARSTGDNAAVLADQAKHMISVHRNELDSFLQSLPKRAFIRELGEALL